MTRRILKAVPIVLLAALVVAPLGAKGSGEAGAEQRVKLRMFTTDAGVPAPVGIDVNDNWAINIVKKYANVDLELQLPAYQDLTTQTRLLLASRDLPDIVRGNLATDMEKAADDGAFIDLTKYWTNSPVVQKFITKPIVDMVRTPKGLFYALPQLNQAALGDLVNVARGDFLQQYGKSPKTVEEYADFLRWVKKTYPNSVPILTRIGTDNIWWTGETFLLWYGVRPYNFSIRGGRVVRDFTLPETREGFAVLRQLYADGVFDKEFMNNQTTTWVTKLNGRDTSLWSYMNYQIAQYAFTFSGNIVRNGGTAGGYFVVLPQLEKYPASVKDPRYTAPYLEAPVTGTRTVISSTSRYPDKAWKVIEAFATDDFQNAINWGQEGIHHKIENGRKVPIIDMIYKRDQNDPKSHNWVASYGIIAGGWFNDAHVGIQQQQLGKEKYDGILASTMWPRQKAQERGTYFMNFVQAIPGVTEKYSEANAFISQATSEFVTGAISAADFTARQEQFKQRYGFITDAVDKYAQENKDRLRRLGVKEFDW